MTSFTYLWTHDCSTETVQEQLAVLGLPFLEHFARALVALLTVRKISLHQVTQLMPGEQNPEVNRQQIRRCFDHESLTHINLRVQARLR